MVLRKQVSPIILDTYSGERIEAVKRVFKETKEMHDNFSSSLGHFFFMQKIKLLKMPTINRAVLLNQTQFFVNYPVLKPFPCATNKNSSAFAKGMRLINARCLHPKNLENRFFDCLNKHGFTVIINSLSREKKIPLSKK